MIIIPEDEKHREDVANNPSTISAESSLTASAGGSTTEHTSAGLSESSDARSILPSEPEEPPPAYSSLPEGSPRQPRAKATNWFHLRRINGTIKESYTIDPLLKIPAGLLPTLGADEIEEGRKNLKLDSWNGAISTKVDLIGKQPEPGDKLSLPRAFLSASSRNGSVTVKVASSTPQHRPRFQLQAKSFNGSVNIQIPRDFHGPISARTLNGSIKLSDELNAKVTTFGEVGGTRKCFAGEFSDWSNETDWLGDELIADTKNGSIRVSYSDEIQPGYSQDKGRGGFLSRWFGF